ncbi:hypothetical protein SOPP22_17640 [Shewanella sp. OPT22]|nr:hypothetical protein SOPP22_17640 [Shewanella sp. OPT22]
MQVPKETVYDFDRTLASSDLEKSFKFSGYFVKMAGTQCRVNHFHLHIEDDQVSFISTKKKECSTPYKFNEKSEDSAYLCLDNSSSKSFTPKQCVESFFSERIKRRRIWLECDTLESSYLNISTSDTKDALELGKTPRLSRHRIAVNKAQWYQIGKNRVTGLRPALTLILDLSQVMSSKSDATPNSKFTAVHPFLEQANNTQAHLKYDPNYLKAMSTFVRLGHNLLTFGNECSFETLYQLFIEFGIPVRPEHYQFTNRKSLCFSSLYPEFNLKTHCYHDHMIITSNCVTDGLHIFHDDVIDPDFLEVLCNSYVHSLKIGEEKPILPHDSTSWLAHAHRQSSFSPKLFLCVTLKDLIIFTTPTAGKTLKHKKEKTTLGDDYFYDAHAILQLGCFVRNGNQLLVCNDLGGEIKQFESIFKNLTNTTAKYLDIDFEENKSNLTAQEYTFEQILNVVAPRPEFLLIHTFLFFEVTGLQSFNLPRDKPFPTFNSKKQLEKVDLEFEKQTKQYTPRFEDEWLQRARADINEKKEKQLVGVFDLDKTLVSYNDKCGRFIQPMIFTEESSGSNFTWYYDPKALESIYHFQKNGHRVVIMTLGSYSPKLVWRLLQVFNISVPEVDLHNAQDIRDGNKARHLDEQVYAHRAMLFDDLIKNRPSTAFFTQVFESVPFIDFRLPNTLKPAASAETLQEEAPQAANDNSKSELVYPSSKS